MNHQSTVSFEQGDLLAALESMDSAALDGLNFGVIGFTADGVVSRYNTYESQAAGISQDRVIGRDLFTEIAQCMNNFLVAQRFEDTRDAGTELDETIDYILTWKMRPMKVQLRMLRSPRFPLQYVAIHRL